MNAVSHFLPCEDRLEGLSQRKVARLLRVAPQSVANQIAQAAGRLEEKQIPFVPPELAAEKMDAP